MAAPVHNDNDDGSELHEINVTPFIDVMLVLLIIFMVTAPLLAKGVKVNLPQASAATVRASASSHRGITSPAPASFAFDSAQNRGRRARNTVSSSVMAFNRGVTPRRRAASIATSAAASCTPRARPGASSACALTERRATPATCT